jgi:hypothetical protein
MATADQRRSYRESPNPVVADDAGLPSDARRAVLLAEYAEAASAWRMLTDVRFKLLALIPPVSALAVVYGVVQLAWALAGVAAALGVP